MSLAGIEVNRLSRTVLVDGEEIILTHTKNLNFRLFNGEQRNRIITSTFIRPVMGI